MSRSKEIIRHASWYAGAYAATQFVTVVTAVLMRRFLGPVQVGVWSLVQVILSYAEYSTMGVASAVPREIPFYVGKGDTKKAEAIGKSTLSFTMLISLVAAAGILGFAFVQRIYISRELFWGLLFCSALWLLQQINNVLIVLLRAFKKFTIAGNQMFLSSIVNAVLVVFLSYRFRLYGFMWAMCLSFIFNILYVLHHKKFVFRFKFNLQIIKGLITYGFSLMALSLLGTFIQTLDRIMITKFLGLEMLGIYSIAVMANGFVFSFPNSIGVVLLPNVAEKYGRNEDRRDLAGYLAESDSVFALLMPVLIALAWFLIPPVVQWVLPKFILGLPALKILVLSSFFMALSQAYGNFIIVIRKQLRLFLVIIVLILSGFGLSYFAIINKWGIVGIATVQVAVACLNFSLVFFLSHFYLGFAKTKIPYFLRLMGKFFLMLVLLFLIDQYVSIRNPVLKALTQSFLFLGCYLRSLLRLDQKYHLFRSLWDKLFRRESAFA